MEISAADASRSVSPLLTWANASRYGSWPEHRGRAARSSPTRSVFSHHGTRVCCCITRQNGETVRIAESALVAGKVVPPAPARGAGGRPAATYDGTGTRSPRGPGRRWRARPLGDWTLRAAGGLHPAGQLGAAARRPGRAAGRGAGRRTATGTASAACPPYVQLRRLRGPRTLRAAGAARLGAGGDTVLSDRAARPAGAARPRADVAAVPHGRRGVARAPTSAPGTWREVALRVRQRGAVGVVRDGPGGRRARRDRAVRRRRAVGRLRRRRGRPRRSGGGASPPP